MADISRLVRTAIQARLADATNGFNVNYAAINGAGTSSYAQPSFQVDWSDRSTNFCYGMVPPNLMEETSVFQYPLLTISSDRGQIDPVAQRVRFHQFSGMLQAMIQVVLSWSDSGFRDFETWPDAVIDAMYQTMNNTALGSALGAGVTYNGEMSFQKGPILLAGQNWRRQILFPLSVRVLTTN